MKKHFSNNKNDKNFRKKSIKESHDPNMKQTK